MSELTLGSLFDGISGFPLAGLLNGIETKWLSEIEPFCIKVSSARFPNAKQLGSVTDIDGGAVEPVDIISFGSPCQDLSVAGKQLGIHEGQRSNLFFEAVRIIKEMRKADEARGRTGKSIRPRFAVWENVPGAFSSNKGADFKAVLEALARVIEADVSIPQPKRWDTGGVSWETAGAWPGGSMTLNTGECPSAARESTLSQILQANAPEKYYLSPKACLGILRRALKRGKELPTMLEEALSECVRLGGEEFGPEEVANAGEILRTLWEKVGAQTFGEWVRRTVILVQQEKVLLCGMRQQDNGGSTVSGTCEIAKDKQETCEKYDSICPVRYLWENWLHGGSPQGRESDEQLAGELGALVQKLSCQTAPFQTFMRCLRSTSEGTPALRETLASVEEEYQAWLGHRIHGEHQEGNGSVELTDGVKCLNPWDAQSKRQFDVNGAYHTLQAYSGGVAEQTESVTQPLKILGGVLAAGFKGCAGAKSGSTGFGIGVSPTLTAQLQTHTVYALQGNGIDRADTAGCNGCGWREGEMYTLNTIDRPAIAFQQNQRDEVRDMGEQAGALTAQPGVHNQNYLCYPETARTLAARHDSSPCVDRGQNVVAYTAKRFSEYDEECGTLRANGGDVGGVRRASSLSVLCYEGQNVCTDTDKAFTLQAGRPDQQHIPTVVYDARGNGDGDTVPTMTGHHNANISDYTAVVVERNDE